MADERKCYAGDLGSDALGKTVIVPRSGLDEGHEGTLTMVSHFVGVTGKPVAELRLAPTVSLGEFRVLTVDDAVTVEVRSEARGSSALRRVNLDKHHGDARSRREDVPSPVGGLHPEVALGVEGVEADALVGLERDAGVDELRHGSPSGVVVPLNVHSAVDPVDPSRGGDAA